MPDCTVYLTKSQNPNRKTEYDLIATEKVREGLPPLLINMDSNIVNDAVEEWLKKGFLFGNNAKIRREVKFENSRFDFYVETQNRKIFLEVKGVTLEDNGVALFPDAPTERGMKHINELILAKESGYEAYILFIVQMKGVKEFTPNYATHKEFGIALEKAKKSGVNIYAFDCIITPDSITVDSPVEIRL